MYVRSYWGEHEFMMVDTGGLENLPANPEAAPRTDRIGGVEILPGMIEAQAAEAGEGSDPRSFSSSMVKRVSPRRTKKFIDG